MNVSQINCCGCGACAEVCPKNCIKLTHNNEGFLKAEINANLCINCGLCLKACPINATGNFNTTISAFHGYNNDEKVKSNSTSGGIFYEIAKSVILNDGVVYGAAYKNDLSIGHVRVDNITDLVRLQGSKYAQSTVNKCYSDIKTDLEDGKTVLFSGTPCQVAAVNNLFKSQFAAQLLTVDLICHGVPSQKLFTDYIKYIEKSKKSKIKSYQFRCKEKSTDFISYNTKIVFLKAKNPKTIIIDGNEDPYVLRFLSNSLQNNICFECPFSTESRCSDITLGDFWGFEKAFPEKENIGKKGISLILVNSSLGADLVDNISNVTRKKIQRDDYIAYNSHLTKPATKNNQRDILYNHYAESGFTKTFYNKYFLPHKYKEYILKRRIWRLIKWIKK